MKIFFCAALLCCAFHGFPQVGARPPSTNDGPLWPAPNYPKGYFRDPLSIPMSLAANFGELRPDHYHMGLDIRTEHREGLPVFASADGHISRVSVGPFGFGQAIYIDHPNGYTTVYGHLSRFIAALAAYVADQQYRQQTWQINIVVPPGLFPVHKGDLIAYSGNTGGSEGPHLHFEIRRTAGDVNLNPLLFGLPVPDNTPPVIQRLAWYDRNQGIYEQSPHLLPVRKGGGGLWTIGPSVMVVPATRISLALSAFDTQSGSTNPNGIFEADLFVDDQPVIGFQLNNISYEYTRNINAHIDFKTRERGGPWLQHLSLLQGYPPPSIYRSWGGGASEQGVDPAGKAHGGNGVIDLGDGRVRRVRIVVKDAYGNSSTLSFRVQYRRRAVVTTGYTGPSDLSMTDSAGKKCYPGMIDGLEIRRGAFYLSEKSLYDSVMLSILTIGVPGAGPSLRGGISEVFRVGEPWVPLGDPVLVRLQPGGAPDVDSVAGAGGVSHVERIVMVCTNGVHKDVRRPEWDKEKRWASARFDEFGDFQLVDDRTPPEIIPLQPLEGVNLGNAPRIAFSARDDLGTVRYFRAELDGAWLCFSNDKGAAYIYKFDGHCPPGRHTLKVSVEDVAGNRTVREYHFIR